VTSKVTYWVAGHLTGIFEIKDSSENTLEKGSLGAGLSIKRGVQTSVSYNEHPNVDIYFNNEKTHSTYSAVTEKVIELLVPAKDRIHFQINHDFEVPLSTGFGASAAGALGCAFSINDYLRLNRSKIELFQIAHQVEVLLKSGLGDIIGLFQGGLEIRIKEGAPSYGKTTAFHNEKNWKLATISFGSLSTSDILSDPHKRQLINSSGHKMVQQLIKIPTFSEFIRLTKKFTRSASLMSLNLQEFITTLPEGIEASQIMLGDSLFLFYQEDDVLEDFAKNKPSIKKEEICQNTVKKGK
jgi:pantoate kinase